MCYGCDVRSSSGGGAGPPAPQWFESHQNTAGSVWGWHGAGRLHSGLGHPGHAPAYWGPRHGGVASKASLGAVDAEEGAVSQEEAETRARQWGGPAGRTRTRRVLAGLRERRSHGLGPRATRRLAVPPKGLDAGFVPSARGGASAGCRPLPGPVSSDSRSAPCRGGEPRPPRGWLWSIWLALRGFGGTCRNASQNEGGAPRAPSPCFCGLSRAPPRGGTQSPHPPKGVVRCTLLPENQQLDHSGPMP